MHLHGAARLHGQTHDEGEREQRGEDDRYLPTTHAGDGGRGMGDGGFRTLLR